MYDVPRNMWLIDFGLRMPLEEAEKYEAHSNMWRACETRTRY